MLRWEYVLATLDRRPRSTLTMALVASLLVYARLLGLETTNGLVPVLSFLIHLGLLFGLYLAAYRAVARLGSPTWVVVLVAGGALAFRLLMLPAGLPAGDDARTKLAALGADLRGQDVVFERSLLYDDDVWRYLWDGHVGAHGTNPFLHPPEAGALDDLAGEEPSPRTDGRDIWGRIRGRVNHPSVPTIYPPGAQVVFRLAHAIAPGSVLVLKSLLVGFDLLAAVFVALGLASLGRPMAPGLLLYAWNPLVVKVFAGSAHADSLVVAALAGTALFLLRRAPAYAGLAFGLAILAKLTPIVLAPVLLRRLGLRGGLTAAAVVAAGAWPFAGDPAALVRGLGTFASEWEFNPAAYALVHGLLEGSPAPALIARAVCGALFVAYLLWLCRRDDGQPESFPRLGTRALLALLVLSPAVMPWYVTWVLPLAVLAAEPAGIVFSGLVCLAFLVLVDGRERGLTLVVEYGALLLATVFLRRRLVPLSPRPPRSQEWPVMKPLAFGVIVLASLSTASPARAQGSGSTGGGFAGPGEFGILRDAQGTLVEVNEKEGVLIVEEQRSQKRLSLKVDPKIKLRADKKTSLGGREGLTLADFKAGHVVRVTYRPAPRGPRDRELAGTDGDAVQMLLRKDKD